MTDSQYSHRWSITSHRYLRHICLILRCPEPVIVVDRCVSGVRWNGGLGLICTSDRRTETTRLSSLSFWSNLTLLFFFFFFLPRWEATHACPEQSENHTEVILEWFGSGPRSSKWSKYPPLCNHNSQLQLLSTRPDRTNTPDWHYYRKPYIA